MAIASNVKLGWVVLSGAPALLAFGFGMVPPVFLINAQKLSISVFLTQQNPQWYSNLHYYLATV